MVQLPLYFDNHATTRVDPRVLEAMLPFFSQDYGNAASRQHVFGQRAAEAVEIARVQVAALIGASPREIIFTSGATESDNLAIKGVVERLRRESPSLGKFGASTAEPIHLITTLTEHHAVLDVCKRLEREGIQVTFLPVDHFGRVTVEQIRDAVTPATRLVSVMAANNEIGTLQPIAEIGRFCKEKGILLHTDAAQAAGKIPLDAEELGVDLLSVSGHKIYGPKGIGALFVRRRRPHVALEPLFDGGGHERGLRSGTLPVPLIVGFGVACELAQQEMTEESLRLQGLRDRLHEGLLRRLPGVRLNGHPTERLPGNLNVSFAGIRGESLLVALKNVAASSGSACTSASVEPSYVLKAIGLTDEEAHSSLRFGLGRFNTAEEVDYAIREISASVATLRALNPEQELAVAPPAKDV